MSRTIAPNPGSWESYPGEKWTRIESAHMRQLRRRSVQLEVDGARLDGALTLQPEMAGMAVLINGNWGIRYAPRENRIAEALNDRGFGTLLVGLLTTEEAADRSARSATDVLASRLAGIIEWLDHGERTADFTPGLVGVGPGVATALRAATCHGTDAGAVVALDGRVDLVEDVLDEVAVPTLFVVDGNKEYLVSPNRSAYRDLDGGDHRCTVLWSDRGTSGGAPEVAPLAADWLDTHLPGDPPGP